MGLAFKSYPNSNGSVHGNLIYVVEYPEHVSDSVAYPNFKFIGDVYIDSELVARLKRVQDPVTGLGIFDVGQIVRNYVNTAFNPIGGILKAQTLGTGKSSVVVTFKLGEEYAFTPSYDMVVDVPRRFFNSYDGRLVDHSIIAEYMNRANTFMYYRNKALISSAFLFISYMPVTTAPVPIEITPFGGGIPLSTSVTPGSAFEMQILNFAPNVLNSIQAGTITSDTLYYTVKVNNDTFRYDLVCEPVYTPYPIHFLNQLGGFDTFIFRKASKRSQTYEKSSFGKLAYVVGSDGIPQFQTSNDVINESTSTYSSQYEEELVINSDFLNEQEYNWLSNLTASPLVYLEEYGRFYPVQIKERRYEIKKYINDDLTNLTLTLSYGATFNAQFR